MKRGQSLPDIYQIYPKSGHRFGGHTITNKKPRSSGVFCLWALMPGNDYIGSAGRLFIAYIVPVVLTD